MANQSKDSNSAAKSPSQAPASSSVNAATRHIGPTLESEGNFADVLGTELPLNQSPSSGAEQEGAGGLDLRTLAQDRADPDASAVGPNLPGNEPEPLKTRLPGDTSSDPHTDLGPDNATTAHGRK